MHSSRRTWTSQPQLPLAQTFLILYTIMSSSTHDPKPTLTRCTCVQEMPVLTILFAPWQDTAKLCPVLSPSIRASNFDACEQEMPVFTAPVAPGQDIPEPHAARPLTQGSSKQPPSPQPAGQEKDEEAPQKPAEPAEAEAEPEAEPPAEVRCTCLTSAIQCFSSGHRPHG